MQTFCALFLYFFVESPKSPPFDQHRGQQNNKVLPSFSSVLLYNWTFSINFIKRGNYKSYKKVRGLSGRNKKTPSITRFLSVPLLVKLWTRPIMPATILEDASMHSRVFSCEHRQNYSTAGCQR